MAQRKPPRNVFPNPAVLKWLVSQFRSPADIEIREEWISGKSFPTYRQLETVASKAKLPFAAFFMPGPPAEPLIPVSFRSRLEKTGTLEQATIQEVTRVFNLQKRLRDESLIPDGKNLSDLRRQNHLEPEDLAKITRQVLDLPNPGEVEYSSYYDALRQMRTQIETRLGIFVLQSSLGDEDLSGFALVESGPPSIIVLNTSDSPDVRRFTLGHEAYHVIKDESDVMLGGDEVPLHRTKDERNADRFAVELLLPETRQTKELFQRVFDGTRASVSTLSRILRLSYTFVLYRARTILKLSPSQFQPLVIPRRKETEEQKGETKSKKVDYYTRKASELGYSLPNLVFERTDLGRLDIGTACELLNLKLESFDNFRDASY